MFKASISILLLITCIITQCAKQFAYLQCKIESTATKTPACDCEKKYDNPVNSLPAPKAHVHISLDEYYMAAENNGQHSIKYYPAGFSHAKVSFISFYNGNIFHPPQFS